MLHFEEMYLDGWMSYTDTHIQLDAPGTTLIRGPIGAGKSALLEAVFYLNFGKTFRNKDSVNDLINKVTNNGYEIWIKQSVGSDKYLIKEIRDRKNKGLYFEKNGKRISGKTDPETRKIINAEWRMSPEEFRAIAFLGQRQSQILIEGTPSERAKIIVDIYGLNKYDVSIDSCEADIKDLNKDVSLLKTSLEGNEIDLSSLEENLLEDIPDDDDVKISLNQVNNIIETLEEKIENIRTSTRSLYETISAIETRRNTADKIKRIRQEIKELSAKLEKYDSEEDRDEVQNELNDLNRKISVLENKIEEAEDKIRKAERIKNECPINNEDCPVKIPSKYKSKILGSAREDKESFEQSLNTLSTKREKCRGSLSKCTERDMLLSYIETKENTIADLDIEDAPEESLEENKEKLAKLNEKLSSRKEKLELARERQLTITRTLSEMSSKRDLQKKVRNALKEKKEAIRAIKNKLTIQSEELQYLSVALSLFRKMKMYKIDLILQTLNENIKEILNNISEGEYKAEFTTQKLSSDKKKTLDKVSIIVYDAYKSMPVELWSGGQSTEVGLAVLLSVWKTAHALSNKGVTSLWLDEVFGPLNEDIVNRVFDAVKETAENLGASSIKIISHRDLDENLFDHVWDVVLEDGITNLKVTQ